VCACVRVGGSPVARRVIGGVCLASIKELDFSVAALFAACLANVFAAFRSNENKKLMETPGLKERIGSVGNQVRPPRPASRVP
jgi:hypothetical protein